MPYNIRIGNLQLTILSHGAVLSGNFRYHLWRTWDHARDPALFIMLNPSTADADIDDQTIKRCIRFAHGWGCGGLEVVNLYAYRTPDPAALLAAHVGGTDIVGPDNDRHIRAAMTRNGRIVLGWGNKPTRIRDGRERTVAALAAPHRPKHLKVTKAGHPQHPLYIHGDTVPVSFPGYRL